jgi:hypothetical protein
MKKYTIHFQGRKLRAKQNPGGGVPSWGEPVVVDEWENTIQSDGHAAIWHLTDFVFPRHGVAGVRFFHVPTQPGFFRACQREDNRGLYNTKGHYFGQVEVQISVSRNDPTLRVGTLNCPPEH